MTSAVRVNPSPDVDDATAYLAATSTDVAAGECLGESSTRSVFGTPRCRSLRSPPSVLSASCEGRDPQAQPPQGAGVARRDLRPLQQMADRSRLRRRLCGRQNAQEGHVLPAGRRRRRGRRQRGRTFLSPSPPRLKLKEYSGVKFGSKADFGLLPLLLNVEVKFHHLEVPVPFPVCFG